MGFKGKNIIAAYSSGVKIDGGSSEFEGLHSFSNGEHGLEIGKDADVLVTDGSFLHNAGSGIYQHGEVVGRARAAGIGSSLNDDELFRALQSVHLAVPADRPGILTNGPLWASYAKTGLDIAGALASIIALFQGGPAS